MLKLAFHRATLLSIDTEGSSTKVGELVARAMATATTVPGASLGTRAF